MKKLVLLAVLAFAGPALAADAEFVLKLATVAPEGTPWAESLLTFKKRVEKESAGRVKLKPYLGGTLGDENLTVQECRRGAIQLWGGSTGALATAVPELALLELPYLFRTAEEADAILDDVVRADFEKVLADRGFVLLFWAENGFRSFGTKAGFIKVAGDLKGKKMRSQEAAVHLEMYRALGSSPVPIPTTEVLSSLQTGVVDGFDQTPIYTFAASWYQGIKNFTLTEHIYQPAAIIMNKAAYDKLPPDLQKIVVGDARAQAAEVRAGVRSIAPQLVENFATAGIQVYTPTAAEREAMARQTRPVYAKWSKGEGKMAKPILDKVQKALEARRKGK